MKNKNFLFILSIIFLINGLYSIYPNSNNEGLKVLIKEKDVLNARKHIKI